MGAANGTVAGQWEYDPFGEVIRATGPMVKANPFRFSTKYQDDESDLLYYGYRYYDSSAGRWPSRDPSEEVGGVNLEEFSGNDPIGFTDPDGLALYAFDGTANEIADQTNVRLTFETGYQSQNKHYLQGIGAEDEHLWFVAKFQQATGIGLAAKRSEMLTHLADEIIKNNDTTVDVSGFSRGSITAIYFAEAVGKLKKYGFYPYCQIDHIRFMGIYDPVTGPTTPAPQGIPDIVANTSIAYSIDEKRTAFAPSVYSGPNITTAAFRGGHSDVGGGYSERGLANISIDWMTEQGIAAGAPFKDPNAPRWDAFTSMMLRHQEPAPIFTSYANRTMLGGVPRHPSVARLIEAPTRRYRYMGVDMTPYTYYLDKIASGNDIYRIGEHKFK